MNNIHKTATVPTSDGHTTSEDPTSNQAKKCNIVVLGLGNIANRIIQGIQEVETAHLYGVASRSIEKAQAAKNQFGADKAYGNHEDVWVDQQVDLVYIATINSTHFDLIKSALMHKKHVICEKPMVQTEAEITSLFALAKQQGLYLMEAHKTLFTPLNQEIKRMVENGDIGNLVSIDATYATNIADKSALSGKWVYDANFGGCTYDLGVYPICYMNYFAGADINDIKTMKVKDEQGVDVYTKGLIHYDNGVIGTHCSGWISNNENIGYLYGTKGFIKTKNFWKNYQATLVHPNGDETPIEVEKTSDFQGEIAHAIDCITKGYSESPIIGEEASKSILRVVLGK